MISRVSRIRSFCGTRKVEGMCEPRIEFFHWNHFKVVSFGKHLGCYGSSNQPVVGGCECTSRNLQVKENVSYYWCSNLWYVFIESLKIIKKCPRNNEVLRLNLVYYRSDTFKESFKFQVAKIPTLIGFLFCFNIC